MTSRPDAQRAIVSRMPGCPPEGGRARPLPPDERRAMLVAATLPLVAQYGPKVTTRQIAEAAGVAEGTIFRVFPDKEALIQAAIAHCLDPAPTLAELRQVDLRLPLRERLTEITGVLQQRLIQVFNVMIALRMHSPPEDARTARGKAPRPSHEAVLEEIIRLLEPDQDQFRCPVSEVARLLRLLTFSGSHPLIADGRLLSAEEIASVVLDGTRRHPQPPEANRPPEANERGDHRC